MKAQFLIDDAGRLSKEALDQISRSWDESDARSKSECLAELAKRRFKPGDPVRVQMLAAIEGTATRFKLKAIATGGSNGPHES